MDITIPHPEFMTQLLEMRISGYFSSPRMLLNGVIVKRIGGEFAVTNDAGCEMSVKLITSSFYRLPQLLIDGEEIKIHSEAGWTQYPGWKQTLLMQWGNQAVQFFLSAIRAKKLTKTAQG